MSGGYWLTATDIPLAMPVVHDVTTCEFDGVNWGETYGASCKTKGGCLTMAVGEEGFKVV